MSSDEQWRAVVGYEGLYEVSDHGRVRSVDRWVHDNNGARTRMFRGVELKPWIIAGTHLNVSLYTPGTRRNFGVHVLVAAAFIGPRPEGMQVCHWDGNGFDNRLANLRYGTPSENGLDTVRYGGNRYASRTECKHGHPYTVENTAYYPKRPRERTCRTCAANRNAEQRVRKRARLTAARQPEAV